MKRALLVVVALVGCNKAKVADVDFRPKHTLTSTAQGSAFVLADGTGEFHITIPNQPTLSADMMEQDGVRVWNAQAVMPGGDVDVQFGAMAPPGGDLPGDLSNLQAVPPQRAGCSAGTCSTARMRASIRSTASARTTTRRAPHAAPSRARSR